MTDREAFEAWAVRYMFTIERGDDGKYVDPVIFYAWVAWQAALAQRPQREIEVLRAERDGARAQRDRCILILTGIHALIYPPPVKDGDKTLVFRPPSITEDMQRLSNAIRAIPDQLEEQRPQQHEVTNALGHTFIVNGPDAAKATEPLTPRPQQAEPVSEPEYKQSPQRKLEYDCDRNVVVITEACPVCAVQQQAEPVAWLHTNEYGGEGVLSFVSRKGEYRSSTPLYAAPPAVQGEPVAIVPRNPSQEWFDKVANALHISDADVKAVHDAFLDAAHPADDDLTDNAARHILAVMMEGDTDDFMQWYKPSEWLGIHRAVAAYLTTHFVRRDDEAVRLLKRAKRERVKALVPLLESIANRLQDEGGYVYTQAEGAPHLRINEAAALLREAYL